jgi:molybdate-binding protein
VCAVTEDEDYDPEANEPVVLREALPYEEAMIVKGLLESAGIYVAAENPRGLSMTSYTRGVPPFLRLLVRRRDYEDAVAALE